MKNAIVTGGNAGLGFQTALSLSKLGYNVTITVRSDDKGSAAKSEIIRANPSASVDFMLLNMSDLSSVVEFCSAYKTKYNTLDLLINNAGIMATPFSKTIDGFESQFQVNHLAHFLLTHHLFPLLRHTEKSRVINLSSRAHLRWQEPLDLNDVVNATEESYDRWQAYGRSKLSNILFSNALNARFPHSESGISFNSLHPGLVNTNLLQNAGLGSSTVATAISVEDGIQCILYLATSEEVEGVSGGYFADCQPVRDSDISTWAQSQTEADKLWDASMRFCNLSESNFGVSS